MVPKAVAYSIEAQLGWDELPPELSADQLAEQGVATEAVEAVQAPAGHGKAMILRVFCSCYRGLTGL